MLPLTIALATLAPFQRPTLDFGRDVRPLLSDRCFPCHGPAADANESGLRLDSRDAAVADLGGYAAIVPGAPEESELVRRIRHSREGLRMPPPESKLSLSGAEIEALERWIREGAPYAEHWAFVPPRRVAPAVGEVQDEAANDASREAANEDWARDDLDRYVLARIEAAGLAPAPEADRASWLRRVTFDLTGLPPTLDELDAFEAAPEEGAFEAVLDRLFASPRHAERMATIWLDAARYADTYGYQADVERDVWPWRDWVIDSFARNQRYDEFLVWQIAGDLLPNATREQRLATTFNRLHRQTNEGGSTEEEFRVEYVADRVQTVSTAALGLTMECARCHDHKFDPLTQEEFYGLFAFFDDIDESGLYSHFTSAVPTPALDLPTEEQARELARLEADVARAEARFATAGSIPRSESRSDPDSNSSPDDRARSSAAGLDCACDLQARYRFDEGFVASLDRLRTAPSAESKVPGESSSPNPFGQSGRSDRSDRSGEPDPLGDGARAESGGGGSGDPPTEDEADAPIGAREVPLDAVSDTSLANDVDATKPGQLHGSVHRVAGHTGGALEFTGDDPVTLPGVGHFRRSDAFTIGLRLWLPKTYERAVVLHRSRAWTDSGSRGYELLIEDGRASTALIHFWPGDAIRIATRDVLPLERWVHVAITYDGSSRAGGLRLYVDGAPVATEIVRDRLTRTILGGGIQHLTLGERFRDKGLAGGRIDDLAVLGRELVAGEVAWLANGESERLADETTRTEHARRAKGGEWREAEAALRVARRARDEARDGVRQIMTMRELAEPRRAYLLARGSYLNPTDEVLPHTPAVLPPLPPGAPRSRLALARWLVDPAHPLTARVEVNRLWQLAFGHGLVRTPEDFGSQGEPPTHPALLDALALDFVESGWDRRALLRRILLSATYRQASTRTARARELDPDGRTYAGLVRRRQSAEMLRDGALFASGLLVETVGGPPVKPYQPAGLWLEKSGRQYVPDEGDGLWRRSLYTFWKRTSPPPSMMILDAAKRDVCSVRRGVTTTPLQALLLWNDPQFVEAARALAARCLAEPSSKASGGRSSDVEVSHAEASDDRPTVDPGERDAAIVARLFRRLTSRRPSAAETELLLALLRDQREAFGARPGDADALLAVGNAKVDDAADPLELAAWTVVAQAVLSHDAAITIR